MAIVHGKGLTGAICEALGIDPAMTQRIVIDIDYQSVPTVYVQGLMSKDQADALVVALAGAEIQVKYIGGIHD